MPSTKKLYSVIEYDSSKAAVPVSGSESGAAQGLVNHLTDPVDAHDGTAISYDGGPNWADATTLSATEVDGAIDEIVSDLGQSTNGAIKISYDPTAAIWADSSSLTEVAAGLAITEIVTQLANSVGAGAGSNKVGAPETISSGSFGTVSAGTLQSQLASLINNAGHLSNANSWSGINTFTNEVHLDQSGTDALSFTNPTDLFRVDSTAAELQWNIGAQQWALVDSIGGNRLLGYDASGNLFISDADTQEFNNSSAHTITAAYSDLSWTLAGTSWAWNLENASNVTAFGATYNSGSPDASYVNVNLPNLKIDGESLGNIYGFTSRNLTWSYDRYSSTGSNAGGTWQFHGQDGQTETGGNDNTDGGGFLFRTGQPGTGGGGAAGLWGPFHLQMDSAAQVRHYYYVDAGVDANDINVIWEDPLGDLADGEMVYAFVRRVSVASGTLPTGAGIANSTGQTSNSYMFWSVNGASAQSVGPNPPDTDILGNTIFDQETNHSWVSGTTTPAIEAEYQGNVSPTGLRDAHYFITVMRAIGR